jgi:hypothetical protein
MQSWHSSGQRRRLLCAAIPELKMNGAKAVVYPKCTLRQRLLEGRTLDVWSKRGDGIREKFRRRSVPCAPGPPPAVADEGNATEDCEVDTSRAAA